MWENIQILHLTYKKNVYRYYRNSISLYKRNPQFHTILFHEGDNMKLFTKLNTSSKLTRK